MVRFLNTLQLAVLSSVAFGAKKSGLTESNGVANEEVSVQELNGVNDAHRPLTAADSGNAAQEILDPYAVLLPLMDSSTGP